MRATTARELTAMAERLVAYGMRQGADQVEATIQEGIEFSVDIRLNEIENLVQAGSRYAAFRVIKDQRTAMATSSDLNGETLEKLMRNAVRRAALAEPDPFSGLPYPAEAPSDSSELALYDPEIPKLSSREKIELAQAAEQVGLDDKRVTNSHGASCETREIQTAIANSHGFSQSVAETFISLGVGLQAGATNDLVEGFWSSTKRFAKELESPESVGRKAAARTVRQLHPQKISTRRIPVVFEADMTGWLMGFLFSCVSGIAVYKRASFLADRLNESIGNSLVSVWDDGLMPGKLGTSPFDSEGVSCRKTAVMEKGILKNFLCNSYAARKLDLSSTGNASGNGVGPTNFYLEAGGISPQEIIRSLDPGLILIRVLGHGLNPITGEISRGAFGLWVEKGEIVHPVSEITISGNLADILNDIEMLGDDLDFRSAVCGPTLKIRELQIAGR